MHDSSLRSKNPVSPALPLPITNTTAISSMNAALGLLGLGSPCTITLDLDGASTRRYVNQTNTSNSTAVQQHQTNHNTNAPAQKQEALPLFTESETVGGKLHIAVKDGKSLQHRGVQVEFVGTIEMLYDRENSQEFTNVVRYLDDPGTIAKERTYTFQFTNAEKTYDTYSGINVRLRYFVRVTLLRAQYTPDITEEFDICVQHCVSEPQANNPIRMEVGIEDALHIEFEYNKSKFHLRDVVIGKIYFLLVRISIKRMEVEIRKRESAGSGANVYNETDTVMKFEVMDGAPVRGESIPVRMFLSACKALTPTYRSINNKFSVKYYLNLVLVDEEDRRYFKQSEITLWRAAYQTF